MNNKEREALEIAKSNAKKAILRWGKNCFVSNKDRKILNDFIEKQQRLIELYHKKESRGKKNGEDLQTDMN